MKRTEKDSKITKFDGENLEEVMRHYLRPASQEEVDTDCSQVLSRLEFPAVERVQRELITDDSPASPFTWPRFAALSAAAVILIAIGIAILLQQYKGVAMVRVAEGTLYRLVDGKPQHVPLGRMLDYGQMARTNDAGSVLVLADTSRVEMRSASEFLIDRVADGIRINLSKGGVIVSAAKQRGGHLYVRTKDMTVSVVGTVFLVNAEEEGSRVAVIEGEVRVQQGATTKSLLPGEQLSTSPRLEAIPVKEELGWSRERDTHVALLLQSAAPHSEPRIEFETVSIRWRQGNGGGGGPRGERPGIDGIPGGPCESPGQVQLDPQRFAVTRAGLLWLITAAYDVGPRGAGGNFDRRCRDAVNLKLLSEGPDWVRTMEFDIQANLPPGIPAYTERQMERGEAPEIQRMLQAMLAERFKLVLKREARDLSVYVLSVAPNGANLIPARERPAKIERDGGVTPANASGGSWGTRQFPDCSSLRRMIEEGVDNEDANRCRRHDYGAGTVFGGVDGRRITLDRFAGQLQAMTQRPVVNRTGIPGVFDIDLIFAPTLPSLTPFLARHINEGRTILSGPTLFKAIEEQMGLRLESSQGPVEAFVIVSVDRPTEN
jgi:uncharacterized protein (TIGR03435 family)